MFRLLFKGTDVIIKKTEKVFVKEDSYLKELVRVLQKTPKRIIRMSYYTIHILYVLHKRVCVVLFAPLTPVALLLF